MKTNYQKLLNILNSVNNNWLKIAILFVVCARMPLIITLLIIVVVFNYQRKGIVVLVLLCSLIKCNFSYTNQLQVVDVKDHYLILQYHHQQYYTKKVDYNYYDILDAKYRVKTLKDTDFNEYLINKNINYELVLDEVYHVTVSNHPKALLYRYIQENFSDVKVQSFLKSVFFNYHLSLFYLNSLHYHFLIIILLLKQKYPTIAIIVNVILLGFDFKTTLFIQLISMLLIKIKQPKDHLGITLIVTTFLYPNIIYQYSFYYYLAFKISNLFYRDYQLKIPLFSLLSIYFYHTMPFYALIFYRWIRWFLIFNSLICGGLLFYPTILQYYIFVIYAIFERIPVFNYYHTISVVSFSICIILLFKFQTKLARLLFYIILFYPNFLKFHQCITIIPDKKPIVIVENNFGQLPVVISQNPLNNYHQQKYGINHYNTSANNIQQYEDSSLIYLNSIFQIGSHSNPKYKPIPIDYYVSDTVDDKIIDYHDVKKVILFDLKDVQDRNQMHLIQRKIPYLSTYKTIRIFYFFGFEWFSNE